MKNLDLKSIVDKIDGKMVLKTLGMVFTIGGLIVSSKTDDIDRREMKKELLEELRNEKN